MRLYRCDQCKKEGGLMWDTRAPVHINGVASSKGGILLPADCQSFDFCSLPCFWNWAEANGPWAGQHTPQHGGQT